MYSPLIECLISAVQSRTQLGKQGTLVALLLGCPSLSTNKGQKPLLSVAVAAASIYIGVIPTSLMMIAKKWARFPCCCSGSCCTTCTAAVLLCELPCLSLRIWQTRHGHERRNILHSSMFPSACYTANLQQAAATFVHRQTVHDAAAMSVQVHQVWLQN